MSTTSTSIKNKVIDAAQQLQERGDIITLFGIKEHVGTGSLSEILSPLTEWQKAQESKEVANYICSIKENLSVARSNVKPLEDDLADAETYNRSKHVNELQNAPPSPKIIKAENSTPSIDMNHSSRVIEPQSESASMPEIKVDKPAPLKDENQAAQTIEPQDESISVKEPKVEKP